MCGHVHGPLHGLLQPRLADLLGEAAKGERQDVDQRERERERVCVDNHMCSIAYPSSLLSIYSCSLDC